MVAGACSIAAALLSSGGRLRSDVPSPCPRSGCRPEGRVSLVFRSLSRIISLSFEIIVWDADLAALSLTAVPNLRIMSCKSNAFVDGTFSSGVVASPELDPRLVRILRSAADEGGARLLVEPLVLVDAEAEVPGQLHGSNDSEGEPKGTEDCDKVSSGTEGGGMLDEGVEDPTEDGVGVVIAYGCVMPGAPTSSSKSSRQIGDSAESPRS